MQRENVRISDTGRRLLDNKELADKVALAILEGKGRLLAGEALKIDNLGVSVQLVTSLEERPAKTDSLR